MQHVLTKWDGDSGGSHFQFVFLRLSFGVSLLRRQALLYGLTYMCLDCTKITVLAFLMFLDCKNLQRSV